MSIIGTEKHVKAFKNSLGRNRQRHQKEEVAEQVEKSHFAKALRTNHRHPQLPGLAAIASWLCAGNE